MCEYGILWQCKRNWVVLKVIGNYMSRCFCIYVCKMQSLLILKVKFALKSASLKSLNKCRITYVMTSLAIFPSLKRVMTPIGFSGSGTVKYFSTIKSMVEEIPLTRPKPSLLSVSIVTGLWANSSNVSENYQGVRGTKILSYQNHLWELEKLE